MSWGHYARTMFTPTMFSRGRPPSVSEAACSGVAARIERVFILIVFILIITIYYISTKRVNASILISILLVWINGFLFRRSDNKPRKLARCCGFLSQRLKWATATGASCVTRALVRFGHVGWLTKACRCLPKLRGKREDIHLSLSLYIYIYIY